MEIQLTEKERECLKLQMNDLIQRKFDSIRELSSVKDDIDIPMRRIVAMFALLGCSPLFSCCGFDYDGQPLHKDHEYGCAYILLSRNENSELVVAWLKDNEFIVDDDDKTTSWTVVADHRSRIQLRSAFTRDHERVGYPWVDKRTCVHYSEIAVLAIGFMEKVLFRLHENFLDEITLVDSNEKTKEQNYNWQYPSLEPWVITKEDILEAINLKSENFARMLK